MAASIRQMSFSLKWIDRRMRACATKPSYICDACGNDIVIPLDLSAGDNQEYVEDCPVCCRANLIHFEYQGEV